MYLSQQRQTKEIAKIKDMRDKQILKILDYKFDPREIAKDGSSIVEIVRCTYGMTMMMIEFGEWEMCCTYLFKSFIGGLVP